MGPRACSGLLLSAQARAAEQGASGESSAHEIRLAGSGPSGVFLDYIAADLKLNRVWVPSGATARVDVIDAATGQVHELTGFAMAELERNGKKRRVGPSSASVGGGRVAVGNRADSSVCIFDAAKMMRLGCTKLSMPCPTGS